MTRTVQMMFNYVKICQWRMRLCPARSVVRWALPAAGKPGHLLVPRATAPKSLRRQLVRRAAAAVRTARRSAFVLLLSDRDKHNRK